VACLATTGLLARAAPPLSPTPAPVLESAIHSAAGQPESDAPAGVPLIAAFSAVLSCCQFAAGLFNFLVSVVMTHCSRTIGAKAWHQLGPRVWMALLTALLCGALVSGILLAARAPIFQLLSLSPELRALAAPLFNVSAATIPAIFINRVVAGVLSGLGRLSVVCSLNVAGSAAEVAAVVLALRIAANSSADDAKTLQGVGEAIAVGIACRSQNRRTVYV
jgi:Na+-driven multidrug efflux pump